MVDEKKVADDAAKKSTSDGKAASEADEGSSIAGAESRKASAGDGKGSEKDAAKNSEASGISKEDFDALSAKLKEAEKANTGLLKQLNDVTEDRDDLAEQNKALAADLELPGVRDDDEPMIGDMSAIDFRVRGLLMAIIMKLPIAARYRSDGAQLDQMVQFVNEFETPDERIVAVEMIKALGEVDLNKIAGGSYASEVRQAMDVVHGLATAINDDRSPDSQNAALNRLQMAQAGTIMPTIPEAAKKGLEDATKPRGVELNGDDQQNAALQRLYSGMNGS